MPKLPQVSGHRLVKALQRIGYVFERQRGSHVRLYKTLPSETHYVTVPMHRVLDKGTLHGILAEVAARNNITQEKILDNL